MCGAEGVVSLNQVRQEDAGLTLRYCEEEKVSKREESEEEKTHTAMRPPSLTQRGRGSR